mgnify:CR=1 FL=1
MKLIRLLVLSLLCALTAPTFAQLSLGTVDAGPYTPGSSIAATFTIDPAACYRQGNVFTMQLSDATGNFATPTTIGTYNSFYATFVNGTIPANTPVGNGYKIRIISSAPVTTSAESGTFSIVAGTAIQARVNGTRNYPGFTDAFGFCTPNTGAAAEIVFSNGSTTGGTTTVNIRDEFTGTGTNYSLSPQITFNPEKKHYTMLAKVVMPNGTIATRAYFIINNETITAFSTTGNNIVCLPGGDLTYLIQTGGTAGIQLNFPGNTYNINWGDGQQDTYNFCDLKDGSVSHRYTRSSCGQPGNVFSLNIQMRNPYCGNVGTPLSTTARVVNLTENRFSGPLVGCSNATLEFVNTSILGESTQSTGATCQADNVTFNWFINGILEESNQPFAFRLRRQLSAGTYIIRLESTGSSGCASVSYERTICVENPPVPSFTLPTLIGCAPYDITPTNTSVVDNRCGSAVTYTWSVSPSTGVTQNYLTSATAAPPTFKFTLPGKYNIGLTITTAGCGAFTAPPQEIVINLPRTVTLSPDITLCTPGTFNFSTVNSPTRTVYSGNDSPTLDDTYTWTVTSSNGKPYSFVGPSNV